ncbi:hypothetical protein C8C96_1841 [Acidovorax sp. 100]|uniref:hypothetical protein n=1 Tax=Acidovorax sp. 100 TaxID=2135635 RepID=UPI000F211FB1|nr:hypothetical protein [Acidovorax sp. 100]RMA60818.1 hypothetical protein C8C96_1841 [Acidovorax sp. 100]
MLQNNNGEVHQGTVEREHPTKRCRDLEGFCPVFAPLAGDGDIYSQLRTLDKCNKWLLARHHSLTISSKNFACHGGAMTYREQLPESCPPQNARHPTESKLWRLLQQQRVTDRDFDSQYLKFPERNFPDMCGAKAVSLMTSLTICRAAAKSPRLKRAGFTHAVEVTCCTTLGIWDQDKPEHVNWWPFSTVNILGHIGPVQVL